MVLLGGCPRPERPRGSQLPALTIEIGRDGATLRGVAADRERTYAALTIGKQAVIEARRGSQVAWTATLDGAAGAIAAGDGVYAAIAGAPGLRGEPGALVAALDPATGAVRWKATVDSTEWSLISSIAAAPEGCVIAGSFSGTLRIGAKVVSTAGGGDGFVAKLAASGDVAWLVRMGGPGADAIQGVATRQSRIAIAGTFAGGADLLGEPLAAYDDRAPYSDGFVAELDRDGQRKWSVTFGSKVDDSVAGVAIDSLGRLVVAANARDVMHVGNAELVAQGEADGLVAWWQPGGERGPAILLGGASFDGLRAIASTEDRVVVGGFFTGSMRFGGRSVMAAGGDDAFVISLDENGGVVEGWQAAGSGREEVAALAAAPGGFVAGITHSDEAMFDGATLARPADPMTGAALAIRGVR